MELNNWRLLDMGRRNASYNMALDEVLLEVRSKNISPNTIRFLQFSPPAALLGYHQSLKQEIRVDFCKESGIDINRRITGGGALFFDETQIGWEIICDKGFFGSNVANTKLFERLSQPLIIALKKLGINAEFRPRNDIEVRGRKISGTGGASDGNAFLFQGTLLVDFDVETMFRALRVPIEKLKFRELESAKERVTCIRWETNFTPSTDYIKRLLRESFEEEFNITLYEAGLTPEEETLLKEKEDNFTSNEWIDKIKLPSNDKDIVYSLYKTDGGVIRTTLELDLKRRRILSALFTGDFFTYPAESILNLEAELKNISIDPVIYEQKIEEFFEREKLYISGTKAADFVSAVDKALEKLSIMKSSISLSEANHIFTVNATFSEIREMKPKHLLLPYCAKSTTCGYRYKKDCIECGNCTIGEAYKLGKEKDMWVTTVLSFEDLIDTLKELKSKGVKSFVGSCCEAFYTKHMEDFYEVGTPGILIDIDSTTCYDLGKATSAYRGSFENKTELNFSLLEKVLNVL